MNPTFFPTGRVEKLTEQREGFQFKLSPTEGRLLVLATAGQTNLNEPDLTIITNWVSTLNGLTLQDK